MNAIIAGFGKDSLELSVFKLGNLVGTTQVARSVSFFDDIKEGLSRFVLEEGLPSRVVIYDGKEGELENIKDALMAANWESVEKVKFLHTPKIEIFSPEKKVTAVALAGAAEIAGVKEVVQKEIQNIVTPEKSLSPQELGFVVGEDIASKHSIQEPVLKPKRFNIGSLKRIFSFFKVPKISGKKNLVLFESVAGFSLILFLLFWIFVPKANIKIYVSPKRFEEKVETTILKDSGSTNLESKIIAGKVVSVTVSGEKTKSTTGTKKIGDKAGGSVNIQNGTGSILKLPGGTLVTAANNLKFSLVTSASISAALSPSTPGTYVVEVKAEDIGAEYNLAKNEVFSVGNYSKSEVDAVSTTDFTGGSSRDISAVSSSDTTNLLSNLTTELSINAKKNLLSEISSDQLLVEDSLVATASSKVFSNKVGDEASNIKLSLDLKTSAISVLKKDLTDLSLNVLSGEIPSDFYLDPANLNYGFTKLKDLSSASLFNLTITANFLPKEDLSLLAKAASGKSTAAVEEIFSKIPGFVTAEINIKPNLPWIFGYLPKLSKNISIEILSEK
ncbi:MAG: hypothetical protein UW51_C0014G0002 [Candidatus Amesbacteria bacterium GW2011_GWA1_44_24]|nr:MAG: hypothetical protein UW51_C0014G0002 [Candidatus Amesbacteria bacterium GW2011_GWA1_44_24]